MKKIKVTARHIYCDMRCTKSIYQGRGIFDCLECSHCDYMDEPVILPLNEYLLSLKSGNCYITKVEIV